MDIHTAGMPHSLVLVRDTKDETCSIVIEFFGAESASAYRKAELLLDAFNSGTAVLLWG